MFDNYDFFYLISLFMFTIYVTMNIYISGLKKQPFTQVSLLVLLLFIVLFLLLILFIFIIILPLSLMVGLDS